MAAQSNSARNMLIVGIVLGLAAGGLGAYSMFSGKVDKPVTELSAPPTKVETLLAGSGQLMNTLNRDHTVVDVAPEGAIVNKKPRFTPIFYSPDLWQVAMDAQKANIVMDLLDPASPNIHNGVPNSWFVANGLMDALGRSDGLTADADGDGFSNFEEYTAQTNPTDAASFPALVAVGREPKLVVAKVMRDSFAIQVDSSVAYENNPSEVTVKLFRKRDDPKPFDTKKALRVGDSFGVGKDDKRFTVLAFVREKYSDSSGSEAEETAVKLRDNVTMAGEKEFVVRAGSVRTNAKEINTHNEKGRVIRDNAAQLLVTAGPAAGKPEGSVTVAERATFKVPGTDIECTLESIDAAGSVNVRPNGAESPINVPVASPGGAK